MNEETAERSDQNAKGLLARKWAERLQKTEEKPGQVVGELIAGGASLVNYAATKEMGWNPKPVVEGRRSLVLFAGDNLYGSSRWGVEGLKAGLSFMVPVDSSKSFGTDRLFMVPYARFTQEGEVDAARSLIFLLNENQINDLKELLEIRPTTTPGAGK